MKKTKRLRRKEFIPKNLKCQFCETKTFPSYIDYKLLLNYTSDRAKIIARIYTGACSKHQKALEREIKRARHLALLPFEAEV